MAPVSAAGPAATGLPGGVWRNSAFRRIWFGQVVCIVTTMGSIMPPIGICCYVVAAMAPGIALRTVFRGGIYYIPAYILSIIILMLSPHWTVLVLSDLVP